jgi:hypothetical protein
VDSQRNPQPETGQEATGDTAVGDTEPAPRRSMFDEAAEADALDEMTRFARKRAAIWGLAAGGVMSLILVVCAVLLYLLGTS